jgi:transposase InsO family protein
MRLAVVVSASDPPRAKWHGATDRPAVLEVFREAGARRGLPAPQLTDNRCVYTTWHRAGPNVMQTELLALGIDSRHSRPYHPQTCGKVERFHQTLTKWLEKQPRARTIAELQAQVDRFVAYSNEVRPHRATARRTPRAAFGRGTRPSRRDPRSGSVRGCGSAGTGSTTTAR